MRKSHGSLWKANFFLLLMKKMSSDIALFIYLCVKNTEKNSLLAVTDNFRSILFVMVPLHAWVMWQDSKKKFVEVFGYHLFMYQQFVLPWTSLPFLCSSYISSLEIHEPAKLNYTSEETFLGKMYSCALSGNLWGSFGAVDDGRT